MTPQPSPAITPTPEKPKSDDDLREELESLGYVDEEES